MKKDYTLKLNDGEELDITAYGNANESIKAIICVHGFKGFKDWGFWNHMGDFLSAHGYFVITFNFSHNGLGKGSTEFNELEKFADNSFSREVRELNELIDATASGFFDGAAFDNISLIGHSRGGAVSILVSSRNPKVRKLITWASIAKLDRYSERQKMEWKKKGFFEVINTRTKQVMRMNVSFLNDIEENKEGTLNIKNALGKLKIPYLIIHGDQDLAVKVEEAQQLFEWANSDNTEIQIINNTGHTFDIVHPFKNTTKKFNEVKSLTLNFLKKE